MFVVQPSQPEWPATDPVAGLAGLIAAVNELDTNGSDRELIESITALEHLKSACAAAQARLTHTFEISQITDGAARRRHPDRTRRSIAAQIALARRDSRHHGHRHLGLGLAHALLTDLPRTLAALKAGELSERRALIITEQLAHLSATDRRTADTRLAAELPQLGDGTARTRAAGIAYRLDPDATMAKIRGAVTDRHVSVRPAPDCMSRLSALLPVAHGVAIHAALAAAAATAAAAGDPRNRGQLMADELTTRITGADITGSDPYGVPEYAPTDTTGTPPRNATTPAAAAAAPAPAPAPAPARRSRPTGLSLNLIMTDQTLLGHDHAPAHLHGHGPIPAALARALVLSNTDTTTATWIRRLYTDPVTGNLHTRPRLFPTKIARYLLHRDQTCRTPWCDAPIRHQDHLHPYSTGGPTTADNGQGLCTACNLSKQAPGWQHHRHPDGTITTTTPTGHTYPSAPPRPPHSPPWPDIHHTETYLSNLLLLCAA